MLTQTLFVKLNTLFDELNTHKLRDVNCGGFTFLEEENRDCVCLGDVRDDDIIISYDFWDDHLKEDEVDECIKWLYDESWVRIRELIINSGYVWIGENDGSGNGLYYGVEQFRKLK